MELKQVVSKAVICIVWVLVAYPTGALAIQIVPLVCARTIGPPAYEVLDAYRGAAWWFHSRLAIFIFMLIGFGIGLICVRFARRFSWRWLILPISVFAFTIWLYSAYRAWGPLLGIGAIVVQTLYACRRAKILWVIVAWVVTVVACLLPWDITFHDYPGAARLVPYAKGLPKEETIAAAKRGELMLGGCVTSGLEPKSVLVW